MTICHRTNSDTNPFELITVDDNALPAHLAHGDVAPVAGGCAQLPVVLGGVLTPVVRPTVLGGVRAQSLSSAAVPIVGVNGVVTGRVGGQAGSLPVTGVDVGALVVLALVLVVTGTGLTASGSRRPAATAGSPGAAGDIAVPPARRGPAIMRSKAPPEVPGRGR